MHNALSCFFPTTVIIVDDSSSFVDSLKESLFKQTNVIFKTFTNPLKALDYINDVSKYNKLDYSNLIRDGEESTSDWKSILLNVNGLHREIYSFDRFSKISTVISDYMMPEINGVDFCSNILDKNIQRILLTGVAEEKKVIEAFNNGYIQQFIRKGSSDFESDILESIDKSIYQYFRVYTDYIAKHVSIGEITHLNDPIFSSFFSKIFSSDDFVEYYMLDVFGSYLLLKTNGQAKVLSVLTENELSRIIDTGIESGEIDDDVLQKLQSRKYMVVSHSRIGLLPPVSEWGKYLCPVEHIEGYQTYYFTLSDSIVPDLDNNEIKSFDLFKKSSFV